MSINKAVSKNLSLHILLLVLSLFANNVIAELSLVQKIFEVGCEFSGVVSRVRRSSTPNPPPEEPNFNDPEELFKYLYPLADVHPDDDSENTGRASHQTHTISSWLEDLMELWHSECLSRRNQRSAERREEYNDRAARANTWSSETHRIRGRADRTKPASTLAKRNSSSGMSLSETLSRRRGENYEGGDYRNEDQGQRYNYENAQNTNESLNGYPYGYPNQGYMDNYKNHNYDNVNYGEDGKSEEELRKDKDKDKHKPKPKPKPTEAPTPPAPPTAAPPEEDIFFASYGGDIEYFFPLLSFGIPFDGEITLLGFHGFRGIFPY